jgi:hypothetical protein
VTARGASNLIGLGLTLGAGIGAAIGVATGNVAIW